MELIEKLRRLCEDRNKSAVSRNAGLPPTRICDYLNKGSMPSATNAVRIARALKVSPAWFIDDSQDWPPVWENPPQEVTKSRSKQAV